MEIKGFWNGKVYGSEKNGYSIYVDGVKTPITKEEKAELENKENVKKIGKILYTIMGWYKYDSGKVKEAIEKVLNENTSFFAMNEKLAPAVVEEAKKDGIKITAEELEKDFIVYEKEILNIVNEKNKKAETEKKKEEEKKIEKIETAKKIDEYIAKNGTPDVVKNNAGYWNEKVYGNKSFGYYIFINKDNGKSKKIYLKDNDLKQFGII